jgi:protein-tyrosine phosphatase
VTVLTPERLLPIEGTFNFRDLGGYTTGDGQSTRWRTLFRSDALHRLSSAGQQSLVELGVRTVIDLRYPAECAEAPCVFDSTDAIAYHRLPLFEDPRRESDGAIPSLELIYQTIVDLRQPQLASVISALVAPDGLPAVINCTAGKDRTGVVVALVLCLVGVDAATIAQDYALSGPLLVNSSLGALVRERVVARGGDPSSAELLMSSPPEHMQRLLTYVDQKYGGAAALAHSAGIPNAHIEVLRAALLE